MIDELKRYLNVMSETIEKDNIVQSLDAVMTGISNDTIPSLETLVKNGDIAVIAKSEILKTISKTTKIKGKDNKEFLSKLKTVFLNILKSEKDLRKLVDKEIPDLITNKTATARTIAIIKLIDDIFGMSNYTLDLTYMIITDPNKSDLPKKKFQNIRENISSYTSALLMYSKDFAKTLTDLSKVSNETIYDKEGNSGMIDKLLGTTGKLMNLPKTQGFKYNPIYWLRMRLVDREIAKYESLKDKKRLLELKLLELRLQEKSESDPALTKQIEYYENKLSKLEYEISELEDNK